MINHSKRIMIVSGVLFFPTHCHSTAGPRPSACLFLSVSAKNKIDSGIAFRVIDRWKWEARLPSSRDHGHPEVRLDCACMERATED